VQIYSYSFQICNKANQISVKIISEKAANTGNNLILKHINFSSRQDFYQAFPPLAEFSLKNGRQNA